MPQGLFKENDDFSSILKINVDLENGNIANSRGAQLQSSSQDPFDEYEASRQPSRRRTSQSSTYMYNIHLYILYMIYKTNINFRKNSEMKIEINRFKISISVQLTNSQVTNQNSSCLFRQSQHQLAAGSTA